MGGIWRSVPVTYTMMWIGPALAGFPFFAGFYSKDMILEVAYAAHSGPHWRWLMCAASTIYAAVIDYGVHGTQASDEAMAHLHESPNNDIAAYTSPIGAMPGWVGYDGLWA